VICTQRFLPFYNKQHTTDYFKVEKNLIQDEIDVFCINKIGDRLKIQVKKADFLVAGNIGKSRKLSIENRKPLSRGNEFVDNIQNNIFLTNKKYRDRGVDVSDIILLLDEMSSPPDFLTKKIRPIITDFKEVWIVLRNDTAIRLQP
jgi:hypothetical protein